jgi:hypothetical protein
MAKHPDDRLQGAATACLISALDAMRVDPAVSIRDE